MARRPALALLLAVTLAVLSSHVERTGPELVIYGNVCGPTASDPCYRPALKGGFPLAYLSDAPGVSVEGRLSFGEDTFSLGAFALDVALYLALLAFAARAVSRRSAPEAEWPDAPHVGSAEEAIATALRFVEAEGDADRFRLETASATEGPSEWRVTFERAELVIPPAGVVAVRKRDGVAAWVPLR
ncbi:MAG TPA: hypothetical protein VF576_09200 [Rubricoccaceae bacterium]|jgi:hypothetical protein